MRASIALAIVALFTSDAAFAARAAQRPDADGTGARMATFEAVWRTIDERFYDPSFNGVDWNGVRATYAPRVASATTDRELYAILDEMLALLESSHVDVVPPAPEKLDVDDPSWGATTGLTVRWIDEQAVVTAVEAGRGASTAGIAPGDLLSRVGALDVAKAYRDVARREPNERARSATMRRTIARSLAGMGGSSVEVVYLDAANRVRTARVARREETGQFGRVGAKSLPTKVEARRLAGDVEYIAFNVFLPATVEAVRARLDATPSSTRAVVLDLRGNVGGEVRSAAALASLFLPDNTSLGTLVARRARVRLRTAASGTVRTVPLVLLVDDATASAAEIVAAALQEAGRALVVGEPSRGAVLPAAVAPLPNGARLEYAVADYRTPRGERLERRGVVPDVAVRATRADYVARRDVVLDAALSRIPEAAGARSAKEAGR